MTARGNGRQAIYLDRDDRLGFLALLQQCVNRFGWLVHTHCLMGNHFHLLLTAREDAAKAATAAELHRRYRAIHGRRAVPPDRFARIG